MKLLTTVLLALISVSMLSAADSLTTYQLPTVAIKTNQATSRLTPVPYTQLDAPELERSYSYKDVAATLSGLPSIISYSQNGNSVGYSMLTMRGFDQRRISVSINGIPQNDPEDHQVYWINFPDLMANIDQVQVQRGAGISSHGAASIGGSINLTTSNFVNRKGIRIYTGMGYQQYGSGDGALVPSASKTSIEYSSGLTDNYAFYGRLSRIMSDGYRDRSGTDLQSYFFSAARFDDELTTQINFFGGPITDGLVYTGLPKAYIKDRSLRRQNYNAWSYENDGETLSYAVQRREQEIEEFSQPHIELLNNWKISDNLMLQSALFYYTGEGYFVYDGTGWGDDIFTAMLAPDLTFPDSAGVKNSLIRGWVSNKQGGWLPRLIYSHDSGELTCGAEIRIHQSEHWGEIPFSEILPEGFDPDYRIYENKGKRNIYSAFVRENYKLSDNLLIMGELQYVHHRYSLGSEKLGEIYTEYYDTDGNIVSGKDDLFDVNYNFLNPKLGVTWLIDDQMSLYGLAAYTSREPRMRNLYAADDKFFWAVPLFRSSVLDNGNTGYDFTDPDAKPESMLDIEIGYNLNIGLLTMNANAYWMEYTDELVKTGKTDINGNPIDENVPNTRHYGIELLAKAELINSKYGRLDLSANATFSKNKIVEFDFVTNGGNVVDLGGNDIAGFPAAMSNLRLSYYYGKDIYVSLSNHFVGEFPTDNFGDLITSDQAVIDHLIADWYTPYYTDNKVDSYSIFNLDIAYTMHDVGYFNSLTLHFHVYNLLDELYAAGGEGANFFPGAERNFFIGLEMGL